MFRLCEWWLKIEGMFKGVCFVTPFGLANGNSGGLAVICSMYVSLNRGWWLTFAASRSRTQRFRNHEN